MIKNLTIKSRLIVTFFFIAITLLGIESISLFGMSKARNSLKTVYEDRIIALDQLTDIESLILQNRIAITASLIASTPEEININITKLKKNEAEINEIWKAYMATYLTPEEKILAAKFSDDYKKFVTQGLIPAAIALRAHDLDKTSRIIVENIRPLYQPVGKGIKTLGKLQLRVTKQEYEEVQRRYDIIRNIIVATAIIGLGLAIWIGFILVRAISRPLEDVVKIARGVAEGNLTQQIKISSTNEIGQLMKALKEIHDNLVKVIGQIRDSEARTRAVLDNVDEGIIAINESGVIEIFNPAAEQIFGYKGNEIIGRNASLLTRESTRDRHKSSLEQPQQLSTPTAPGVSREMVGVRKNGTKFPLEFKTREIRFNIGQLHIVVTRDLTASKQAEAEHKKHEQVQQRNVELEAASRMKSEFFSTMSHELRTPLNAIIGFSEVLKDGLMGDLTDEQRGYISDILESGQHQLALINDILDLSKMEAGKMILHLEPINLPLLFSNSLSMVREKAAAQHIHLNLDIADGLGDIQADLRKVKQIVYNLLSNAVKFTPAGGNITMRARRVSRAQVGQLTSQWGGLSFPWNNHKITDFIEISVTDSGIGIANENFERLFKPFSQIDSSLARKFEGTGLGLAIVKSLVELHDGTVAVESAEGQGTCFTVWLPLWMTEETVTALTEEPADSALPSPLMALRHSGERFALVVEDDDRAAELIRIQLELLDIKTLRAVSAETAFSLAMQQPLALITLDILLPNMIGWEFLTRIKKIPALAHIPVVIISTMADRCMGLSLGASAILQKPISRADLHDTLTDLGLHTTSSAQPKQPLTILIVDDDLMAVEIIALHLQDTSYTVVKAHGGREAIEMAYRLLPDLIVLDLLMPEINGFDVVLALKNSTDTARIPILVVTSKQLTAEDRAALDPHVTKIINKTVLNQDQFLNEVRWALMIRREED
ncbi:Histidine kinase [Candidatus Nitrotoga sp. HW29]|uniref:Tar ligand binding domain-containing protein n=1 Tax=Candidatus Nitrotoga sp. HW29 TaxID=2886963 RepID=UPI001EF2FDE6|nr:Tar ligand binding domain-containing protein [Candidatus Nitrotoga sp. HW29]CAH1905606.1 Histidine kinase [Candidatus Nitrotoga sp. HW29]